MGRTIWDWQDLIICLGFSITRHTAGRAISNFEAERVGTERAKCSGNGKRELIASFSATMVTI